MKFTLTITLLSLLCFFSCKTQNKQQEPVKETPKALQEKSSEFELTSKGRYSDMVDDLYQELSGKNPGFKNLNNEIEEFYGRKPDSLYQAQLFFKKNETFYTSAAAHLASIKDSTLRDKIKTIIFSSESMYKVKSSGIRDLIAKLETRTTALRDLHEVLKITKTLSMIQQYQNEHLPAAKPVESILKDAEKLILKTDSLSKN